MAIFKCKMCGGQLDISEGMTVCECEYCGTQQTLPKLQDDVTANLFNRANNLRMKSEFDKALEIYEKIVASNPAESEAYWGLVLCKYGIEYVEDPATLKKIPTCHRTQLESIMTDIDYQSAVEHADSVQRSVYEREAAAIDKLQKDILAIVHKEKPFDVFICYKETDENGKRTIDSVIANDIYHQLTQEGFKVFYAAITLEDKLGQEYEPYIFAALNSAKVMLCIGTKSEYFNAVWVKNEWSRFFKLMKADRSKLLIPCYKDMDAYDLPDEFSHLQAQDMGKIGFINDLIRGIKKVIVKDEPKPQVVQQTVIEQASSNVENLLKRGNLALEDGDWNKAVRFFEQALNEDVEEGRAHLGKLLAGLHLHAEAELADRGIVLPENKDYNSAVRFSAPDLKARLEKYAADAKRKLEQSCDILIKYEAARSDNSLESRINAVRSEIEANEQKLETLKTKAEKLRTAISNLSLDDLERQKQSIETALQDAQSRYDELTHKTNEISDEISRLSFFKKKKKAELNELLQQTYAQKNAVGDELSKNQEQLKNIQTDINVYTELKTNTSAISELEDQKLPTLKEQLRTLEDELQKYKTEHPEDVTEEAYQEALSWLKAQPVPTLQQYGVFELLPFAQRIRIFNRVKFGNYWWYVINRSENTCTLLCERSIAQIPYHIIREDITWEECTLRTWLNNDFYNEFSDEEKTKIVMTHNHTPGKDEIRGGNDTDDHVFLLSEDEAEKLSDNIKNTVNYVSWWWLRSPGSRQDTAKCMEHNGKIYEHNSVDYHLPEVRPALTIKFN